MKEKDPSPQDSEQTSLRSPEMSSLKIFSFQEAQRQPFLSVFRFQEDSFSGQEGLFGVIQVFDYSNQSAHLPSFLAQVIRKEFFAQPEKKLESRFEDTLKKVNLTLADLAQKGITAWVGNFHAAFGVIQDGNLIFTRSGGGQILLGRVHQIIDLSRGLEAPLDPPHPLKTFTDILEGRLREDEKIIFATDSVLDFFPLQKLEKSFHSLENEEFDILLKSTLEAKKEDLGAVIVNLNDPLLRLTRLQEVQRAAQEKNSSQTQTPPKEEKREETKKEEEEEKKEEKVPTEQKTEASGKKEGKEKEKEKEPEGKSKEEGKPTGAPLTAAQLKNQLQTSSSEKHSSEEEQQKEATEKEVEPSKEDQESEIPLEQSTKSSPEPSQTPPKEEKFPTEQKTEASGKKEGKEKEKKLPSQDSPNQERSQQNQSKLTDSKSQTKEKKQPEETSPGKKEDPQKQPSGASSQKKTTETVEQIRRKSELAQASEKVTSIMETLEKERRSDSSPIKRIHPKDQPNKNSTKEKEDNNQEEKQPREQQGSEEKSPPIDIYVNEKINFSKMLTEKRQAASDDSQAKKFADYAQTQSEVHVSKEDLDQIDQDYQKRRAQLEKKLNSFFESRPASSASDSETTATQPESPEPSPSPKITVDSLSSQAPSRGQYQPPLVEKTDSSERFPKDQSTTIDPLDSSEEFQKTNFLRKIKGLFSFLINKVKRPFSNLPSAKPSPKNQPLQKAEIPSESIKISSKEETSATPKFQKYFSALIGLALIIGAIFSIYLVFQKISSPQEETPAASESESETGDKSTTETPPSPSPEESVEQDQVEISRIAQADGKIISLTGLQQELFALTEAGNFWKITPQGNRAQKIDLPPGVSDPQAVITMPDLTRIFIISSDRVDSYSPTAEKFFEEVINLPDNLKIGGQGVYSSFLYIFNQTDGQIYRYPREGVSFGLPVEWLDEPLGENQVTDMSVDESIRLIYPDGKIETYASRTLQETFKFSMEDSRQDPSLSRIDSYLKEEEGRAYILDQTNSLIAKIDLANEEILETYPHEKLSQAEAIWSNTESNDLYFTQDAEVFRVEMEQ